MKQVFVIAAARVFRDHGSSTMGEKALPVRSVDRDVNILRKCIMAYVQQTTATALSPTHRHTAKARWAVSNQGTQDATTRPLPGLCEELFWEIHWHGSGKAVDNGRLVELLQHLPESINSMLPLSSTSSQVGSRDRNAGRYGTVHFPLLRTCCGRCSHLEKESSLI
jgi:hypothetical protein